MVFIIDLPENDGPQVPLPYYQEVVQPVTPTKPAVAAARLEAAAQIRQFQVGEFTLGDTDCPSLTGHPDIRY